MANVKERSTKQHQATTVIVARQRFSKTLNR
jgi:hypothetical protein